MLRWVLVLVAMVVPGAGEARAESELGLEYRCASGRDVAEFYPFNLEDPNPVRLRSDPQFPAETKMVDEDATRELTVDCTLDAGTVIRLRVYSDENRRGGGRFSSYSVSIWINRVKFISGMILTTRNADLHFPGSGDVRSIVVGSQMMTVCRVISGRRFQCEELTLPSPGVVWEVDSVEYPETGSPRPEGSLVMLSVPELCAAMRAAGRPDTPPLPPADAEAVQWRDGWPDAAPPGYQGPRHALLDVHNTGRAETVRAYYVVYGSGWETWRLAVLPPRTRWPERGEQALRPGIDLFGGPPATLFRWRGRTYLIGDNSVDLPTPYGLVRLCEFRFHHNH